MLYLKAFHLTFMVMWFAGLFYIVRLFIYHAEAAQKEASTRGALQDQLSLMASRLWYIITWPGMVLTVAFGLALIYVRPDIMTEGWFHAKLLLLIFLIGYHFACGSILRKLTQNKLLMSSGRLRLLNEAPTVLLFAIVFLAVLKETMSLLPAMGGLLALMILLMAGIRFYKTVREKKAS